MNGLLLKKNPISINQQMQNFVKELFVKPEVSVIGAARGPAGIFFIILYLKNQKKQKIFSTF